MSPVDYVQIGLELLLSVPVSLILYFVGERASRRRNEQLLAAISKVREGSSGGDKASRKVTEAGGARSKRGGRARPSTPSGGTTDQYRGISPSPPEPSSVVVRFGRSRWVKRLRTLLTAAFLLILSPWLVAYWLVKWSISNTLVLVVVWYQVTPARPLLNTLFEFEDWGFWALVALLAGIGILTWVRGQWKSWAFLHPEEIRLYSDGRLVSVSSEVVRPSRALAFLVFESTYLTPIVLAAFALWFILAPLTQLHTDYYLSDPTEILVFLPAFLTLVMVGWSSTLWVSAAILRSQVSTVMQHQAVIEGYRPQFQQPSRSSRSSVRPSAASERSG